MGRCSLGMGSIHVDVIDKAYVDTVPVPFMGRWLWGMACAASIRCGGRCPCYLPLPKPCWTECTSPEPNTPGQGRDCRPFTPYLAAMGLQIATRDAVLCFGPMCSFHVLVDLLNVERRSRFGVTSVDVVNDTYNSTTPR